MVAADVIQRRNYLIAVLYYYN